MNLKVKYPNNIWADTNNFFIGKKILFYYTFLKKKNKI